MHMPLAADSTHFYYGLDSLLGHQTQSATCQFDVKRFDDAEPAWYVLHVRPPLPDDLDKAQIVVFSAEGRQISGIVRSTERLDDGSLRLNVEPS
ncbi:MULTISPECIES: hypothetical protein [Pseudomonas]|jgi:hypothetical protein|uniref:Uncharacterized protein n=1 Tax=Pseudomonas beijingensis TaxID=2954101 RepID=A0ABY9FJD6_9PSED|nr:MULTISPECIES: hypothetical protein [unclassified Pseudomonas]WLH03174.1 hypothetical protein PSH92_09955 [Pseudomonas sp. FP2034]WLH48229.1 hypothetical protein PSH83_10005 [Pseudomonas sp. FP2262]WLI42943.1 hypothetical protein PSH84_14890 [Pseudomonas sp. FP830]